MSSCLLKSLCLPSLRNSYPKYVVNKVMPGWFESFSVCLGNMFKKNCWRLSRKLCVLCQQWLWHTSTFCQVLWFVFLITVEITCSIGEHSIQCWKNSALKIWLCVKTKVKNINWGWWKKAGREWWKKDKRLTDKQVSIKDFTNEKKSNAVS